MLDDSYSAFRKQLKALRLRRGWTQATIAEEIGVSRTQYIAIEGGRSMVTYRNLYNLALALDTRFTVGPKR